MTTDFSLTNCGPLDRLVARTGPRRVVLRAVLFAAITWVPLLVLALLERRAGEAAAVGFLQDLSTHVRFLIVIPLLIFAEAPIGERTRRVAANFPASGLVGAPDRPRFDEIVGKSRRLLNSSVVEVILVVISVLATSQSVRALSDDGVVFWFETPGSGGERLSPAGYAYVVASPIVGFLFLRWAWRYAIWCRFLHRLSKLDLRIAGTHPDRAGGLGFVGFGQQSFALIALAGSLVLASATATETLFAGVPLATYKYALAAFVVLVVLVGLAPLPVFAGPLARAKRDGLVRYGNLATRYVQSFEGKWLGDGPPPEEPLLGSADVQSLADLGGSYERLEAMRPTPFDKRTIIAFAAAAAGPLLPLLLTVMPLKDILKLLVKALA